MAQLFFVYSLTAFSSRSDQAVTYISIALSGERQDLNAIIGKRHQARHFKTRDVGL